MNIQLDIESEHVPSVAVCLAIGTLYAIQQKRLATKEGIWTVGVPRFWEPLIDLPSLPPDIIEVFQTCDELSAIEQLLPDRLDSAIEELLNRLMHYIAHVQDPAWGMG